MYQRTGVLPPTSGTARHHCSTPPGPCLETDPGHHLDPAWDGEPAHFCRPADLCRMAGPGHQVAASAWAGEQPLPTMAQTCLSFPPARQTHSLRAAEPPTHTQSWDHDRHASPLCTSGTCTVPGCTHSPTRRPVLRSHADRCPPSKSAASSCPQRSSSFCKGHVLLESRGKSLSTNYTCPGTCPQQASLPCQSLRSPKPAELGCHVPRRPTPPWKLQQE